VLCGRAGQSQGLPPARHTGVRARPGLDPGTKPGSGKRTSAPQAQRTKSAYLFGATCPQKGKAAGLVLPFCNIDTINLHLAEIAKRLVPGAHAVLLMNQAGWYMSAKVAAPGNISIASLPVKCLGLNSQENVWQFPRDNWLASHVFVSYDEIVGHCRDAWSRRVDQSATATANLPSVCLVESGPDSTRKSTRLDLFEPSYR